MIGSHLYGIRWHRPTPTQAPRIHHHLQFMLEPWKGSWWEACNTKPMLQHTDDQELEKNLVGTPGQCRFYAKYITNTVEYIIQYTGIKISKYMWLQYAITGHNTILSAGWDETTDTETEVHGHAQPFLSPQSQFRNFLRNVTPQPQLRNSAIAIFSEVRNLRASLPQQ